MKILGLQYRAIHAAPPGGKCDLIQLMALKKQSGDD
jgi:hypothetical protein